MIIIRIYLVPSDLDLDGLGFMLLGTQVNHEIDDFLNDLEGSVWIFNLIIYRK